MRSIVALAALALSGSLDLAAASRCKPSTTIGFTSTTNTETATSTETTQPPVVTNDIKGGRFARRDPSDPVPEFTVEGEAEVENGKGYTGDGSKDSGAAKLHASSQGGSKRALGSFVSISQQVSGLDPSKLYTVRLYYAVFVYPSSPDLCYLRGSLGSQQFFEESIPASPGSRSLTYGSVLKQTSAPGGTAAFTISMQCMNGAASVIYVDSIFMSNQVTPATIDDYTLDYGDDDQGSSTTTADAGSSETTDQPGTSTNTETGTDATETSGTQTETETQTSTESAGTDSQTQTGTELTATDTQSQTGTESTGTDTQTQTSAESTETDSQTQTSTDTEVSATQTSTGTESSQTDAGTTTTTGTETSQTESDSATTSASETSEGSTTSDEPTSTTATTSSASSEPTASRICANVGSNPDDGKGCDRRPLTQASGNYWEKIGNIEKEQCAAACLADDNCGSFEWRYVNDCHKECRLYATRLDANSPTSPETDDSIHANDRSCAWKIPCPPYPADSHCLNKLADTPSPSCTRRKATLKSCAQPWLRLSVSCTPEDSCAGNCATYTGCKSFSLSSDPNEVHNCLLYTDPVSVISNPDDSSDLEFVDLSCYDCNGENMPLTTYTEPMDDNTPKPDNTCPASGANMFLAIRGAPATTLLARVRASPV
ncbi:hypothetical protein FALBO_13478 [Fusarium albosuccineum]|uniref:Apple domain-containing protein n=1 Tax=Fusarium albosuccineum TaxID=1237068 RepID=A0A8H4P722_9HYPO|nr:hypothetical protein FALBO_13478 [Fusarium albosuccineum]